MKEIYAAYPAPRAVCERLKNEIIFFQFEEDFVEENVRCIPMIVRFKLDACGIKLKLSEWAKMTVEERKILAEMDCATAGNMLLYRDFLRGLIMKRAGSAATALPVELNPVWQDTNLLPAVLVEKMGEFNWGISLPQWRGLSNLQRFALMKLCKPGHENKNFPRAVREFGLVK